MNTVRRLEFHDAVFQRVKSKIASLSDKMTGEKLRTLLANENTAGFHELPAVAFNTEPLGIRVAAVFGTA